MFHVDFNTHPGAVCGKSPVPSLLSSHSTIAVLCAVFGGTVALVSLSAKMISVIAASDEEAQLQMLSEQLIMMQEQQNISETYTP